MATYAFAAPVLSGTTDKYRAFTEALVTSRREEAEASRRSAGLNRRPAERNRRTSSRLGVSAAPAATIPAWYSSGTS